MDWSIQELKVTCGNQETTQILITPERALDVQLQETKNYLGQGVKVVSGTVTYDAFGNILTKDTREFAANDIYTTYQQSVIDLHNSSAWGSNSTPADTYSKSYFKLREISLTYDFPLNLYSHYGFAKGSFPQSVLSDKTYF